MPRKQQEHERKHLFHVGLNPKELRKIKLLAVRDGVSQAEATRRIIDHVDIDKLPPPAPAKKRRGASALSTGANGNA